MHTTMLGKIGPPYAMMPSYITAFQSSPVRICKESPPKRTEKDRQTEWEKYHNTWNICVDRSSDIVRHWGDVNHLETSEQSLREGVKSASLHLSLVEVEFASKQLHAQQGEDDEEEEEQEQEGADGFHGVEQWVDQVWQSSPVPANNDKESLRNWG